jgi:hypothetical protein
MCDYSLEHYQSRPARQGEEYVTHRFASGSIGFIAPTEPSVAVCMTCDMRLKVEGLPILMRARLKVAGAEVVTFTRLDSGLYRDGVRFDNGELLSLQELGTGLKAQLVDALADPLPAREPVAIRQPVLAEIA